MKRIMAFASFLLLALAALAWSQGFDPGNRSANICLTGSNLTATQGQCPVFDCPATWTDITVASGPCAVQITFSDTAPFWTGGGHNGGGDPTISGGLLTLVVSGCTHCGYNLNYQTLVNVQKFTTTFTFVPDGWNVSLVMQNSTNNPFGPNLSKFAAGAACEGSFFQGFAQAAPPNFVFALELDSASQQSMVFATGATPGFLGSTAQIYRTDTTPVGSTIPPGQSPCMIDQASFSSNPQNFSPVINVDKILTSPVQLNSPSTASLTSTGDTYSATIAYDGSNLVLTLFDLTAGGTCAPTTSGTCFTKTWTGVNIPAYVGANTAYVGLAGSTDTAPATPLLIKNWKFATPL